MKWLCWLIGHRFERHDGYAVTLDGLVPRSWVQCRRCGRQE